MATKNEVMDVMLDLAAAWPHTKLTDRSFNVYCDDLSDLDPVLLRAAAKKLRAMGGEFFPSISAIRSAAVGLALPERQSALVAWEEVRRNMILHGAEHPPGEGPNPITGSTYHSWQFEDPITDRVVSGMGWRELCMGEKEAVDRAHFIHSYEEERDRAYEAMQVPEEVHQLAAQRRVEAQGLFARILTRLFPRPERRDAASQTTAADPGRALTRAPAGAVRQGEGEGAAEEGAREEGQGPRQVRPGARPHPGRARGQR